jgi:hypothetical protein
MNHSLIRSFNTSYKSVSVNANSSFRSFQDIYIPCCKCSWSLARRSARSLLVIVKPFEGEGSENVYYLEVIINPRIINILHTINHQSSGNGNRILVRQWMRRKNTRFKRYREAELRRLFEVVRCQGGTLCSFLHQNSLV